MNTLDWLLLALVALAAVAAIRRWRKKGSCSRTPWSRKTR